MGGPLSFPPSGRPGVLGRRLPRPFLFFLASAEMGIFPFLMRFFWPVNFRFPPLVVALPADLPILFFPKINGMVTFFSLPGVSRHFPLLCASKPLFPFSEDEESVISPDTPMALEPKRQLSFFSSEAIFPLRKGSCFSHVEVMIQGLLSFLIALPTVSKEIFLSR